MEKNEEDPVLAIEILEPKSNKFYESIISLLLFCISSIFMIISNKANKKRIRKKY